MVNNTPQWHKKALRSTKPETHQAAKCISSFLSYFSFSFSQWVSSKLCHSITMVFTQNNSILHRTVQQQIAFHNFEVYNTVQLVSQELWLHFRCHFLQLYTCTPAWVLFKTWFQPCSIFSFTYSSSSYTCSPSC